MNFWKNLFTSKKEVKTESIEEEKSSNCTNYVQPYVFGVNSGISMLRNTNAWRYYKKISPVFDACRRKSRGMLTVKPAIYDSENEEYFYDYDSSQPVTEILNILKNPNREKTWIEFVESVVPSYEVTGDIFIMVTSLNETNKPLEMYYINPDSLTSVESTTGNVYCWQLDNNQWNEKFFYVEDSRNGISSYFTQDGTKELWQIKEFNPNECRGDFFGLSPLNAIFEEIEQYEYSNTHNKSVLKNGATPSGVMVVDKEFHLGDDQYERMKAQIQSKYSGASNAGNILILEGGKDFKQLSMNNKDMDFLNLLKFVREQIYITKGIPLPMVTAESMTMNNFEESKYMMFDTDILPFADKLYLELTNLLVRRYDLSGRFSIAYNPELVPALQAKRTAEIKNKIDSKVITTNESRALLGYEDIDGGDTVLVPTTLQPLGMTEDSVDDEGVKYDYTTAHGKYRLRLEELINEEGQRKFTDEEIDKKVFSLYGVK